MAKFIREYKCGVVVTERSEEAVMNAIDFLQSGSDEVKEMQSQALKAVEMF